MIKRDTKGISYWYIIIGLAYIILGAIIGILSNMGTFEQFINSKPLLALNTNVVGTLVAFIFILIGTLLLVLGKRS